ncbi:hypothetical protein J6590_080125 [Homalodisca vitripennis]|nr:hypothetical protein J6590_080125 [Homalodisca vitripennis]
MTHQHVVSSSVDQPVPTCIRAELRSGNNIEKVLPRCGDIRVVNGVVGVGGRDQALQLQPQHWTQIIIPSHIQGCTRPPSRGEKFFRIRFSETFEMFNNFPYTVPSNLTDLETKTSDLFSCIGKMILVVPRSWAKLGRIVASLLVANKQITVAEVLARGGCGRDVWRSIELCEYYLLYYYHVLIDVCT